MIGQRRAITKADILNIDRFTTRRIKVRPRTSKGEREFHNWIVNRCWNDVMGLSSACEQAAAFVGVLDAAIDDFFQEKEIKIKSTDDP